MSESGCLVHGVVKRGRWLCCPCCYWRDGAGANAFVMGGIVYVSDGVLASAALEGRHGVILMRKIKESVRCVRTDCRKTLRNDRLNGELLEDMLRCVIGGRRENQKRKT